ncbi:flavin-binding monooxygenase-like family protein [Corynespora cassiicola Philippines]|uniref:Flavin-binding monooxygenase-like family protein n=1 Tax=Corynespora cassiicola Philippines TaxID=1448308 RepID=A0A2T2NV48_CORCC|nr:flavin-binding monooxygenase-like family protein [Corynespora cassiicola Philippines]
MPATAADLIATIQDYSDETLPEVDALQVEKRYSEERAKRLRDDGIEQYVDVAFSEKFKSFLDDPFVDPAAAKDAKSSFPDNRGYFVILGAGWGGLMYAVRLVQSGVEPKDIRIVDPATGFGGTWYWNRYPGLFCDIESYCYLPLLEETGYIPKHRYSTGEEIRNYAESTARKWGVADCAVWQTQAEKLIWDENAKEWQVTLVQKRSGEEPQKLNIRAPFVATVNGVLSWPKIPGVSGVLDYQGDIFHSSRWNYALTGGSPDDPSLGKLQGKRVAIIGTGATSCQIVPHLAKWVKHLYVVQRTPAAVDVRDQRETDQEWFRKEVAISKGWQRERMKNFHNHFTTEKQPDVNLVDDGWTRAPTMCAIAGNVHGPKTMEELPAYMQKLNAMDLPRQERIRKRVEQIVKDPVVAKRLQAWYPTWCKRPAFHDEYLETFNRENVTLIDTEGKGLKGLTADSIVAGGETYPVDLIVFATGFRPPFTGSPAQKANLTIIGRNGVSMDEEWGKNGPSTQHAVLDYNFPNLFLAGPWQGSNSPNYLFNVDLLAQSTAYILSEARKKAGDKPITVAPSAEAAQNWGMQVLMHSAPMAGIIGCTPGYFNVEGMLDRTPPEMQMVLARSGLWGHGIEDFTRIVNEWRAEGSMLGIDVHF